MNDRSYVQRNDAERAQLQTLVDRLCDVDLGHLLSDGWTVSAVLAHIAFWDRRTLASLEEWEQHGVRGSLSDWDAINASTLREWLATPPRDAGQQAVAAAAVDQKIAAPSDELIEAILDSGRVRPLDRSIHRREHLDEIERELARG